MWPFSRKSNRNDRWNPERPLVRWSRREAWSLRDAWNGTLILGATGSGKTSGSGQMIAEAFLNGFGGLVLTSKPDERDLWISYCRRTGRLSDLVVFGLDQPWRFNFIAHAMSRSSGGAGLTENVVNLLSTVLELGDRNSGQGSGRQDEAYWRRANRQLCRNLVDLLALSGGRITIPDLYRLVVSAPTSREQIASDDWKRNSFCFHSLAEADKRPKTPRERRDLETVADYFLVEYPNLSDKTRSVIVSTFTSMIDVLNRGILRELFCTETNLTPDAVEDGKIILIDLPVKEYAEVGQFAQVIWKYVFMRSIERRDIRLSPRPVFLWADEAQNFLTSYDFQFATTCRSARVATVLLSQNVSNFFAVLGGEQAGKAQADSLFGNLNTKIFHANGDPVTNEWAATLIGRTRQFFVNANNSYQPDDWMASGSWSRPEPHTSAGVSESYEYEVQPSVFTTLRTGGPENQCNVDAIVVQNGRTFADTGRGWRLATFGQRR